MCVVLCEGCRVDKMNIVCIFLSIISFFLFCNSKSVIVYARVLVIISNLSYC